MNLANQLVWFTGNDRASPDPVFASRRFPAFSKSSEHKRATVFHLDIVRNLSAQDFAPFVESIDRNEAPGVS